MWRSKILELNHPWLRKVLTAFLIAGRAEYFMADMLPFVAGILLGIGDVLSESEGLRLRLVVGLVVTVCAHYTSVWANVIGDYELDKKFKKYLPSAVDVVGGRFLAIGILFTVTVGTLLIIYLARLTSLILLVFLWIIGIFFALAYSNKPLRLKRYVFAGDFARGIQLVILLPFGFFVATGSNFSTKGLAALALYATGLGVNLLGLFLVGECWDWKDDKGLVETVATRYGYKRSLKWSGPLIVFGIGLMMIGFVVKGEPFGNYLHATWLLIWLFLTICIMLAFYLKIYSRKDDYHAIENACGLFTKAGTTAIWGLMAVSCAILL